MSIRSQLGACLQPRPPARSYGTSQHSNRSTSKTRSLTLPFGGRMARWLYGVEPRPKCGCQEERGVCLARWSLNHAGSCQSSLRSYPTPGKSTWPQSNAGQWHVVPRGCCGKVFCRMNRVVLFPVDPSTPCFLPCKASCGWSCSLHHAKETFVPSPHVLLSMLGVLHSEHPPLIH